MADDQQVQGLPPGAEVRPLAAPKNADIEGLPEGAEIRPLAKQQAPAAKPSRAEHWWTTPTRDTSPSPSMPMIPSSATGSYMSGESSPREQFQGASTIVGAGVAPLAIAGAPVAGTLAVGGSLVGGKALAPVGRYFGGKFNSPTIGEDIGGLTGSVIGGYSGARAPELFRPVRTSVGDYIRDAETGKLKPAAKAASQTVGAIGGTAAGEAIGHPYVGAGLGYKLGPSLTEAVFPESSGRVLQRATTGLGTDWGKPTPAEVPASVGATQPSAEEFYNRRGLENLAIMKNTAAAERAAEAAKPKIVVSGSGVRDVPFSGSEGRAATWTNEAVLAEAMKGNRVAIEQVIRRGLPMPANARYVMGDPDSFRAVFNPRETTHFTPEGEPIRNAAPPEKSSRAKIAAPPAESRPRESINAKTGEVVKRGAPQERESAVEAARRGAPGKNPATRSVERHNEKLRRSGESTREQGARLKRKGKIE